MKPKVRLHTLLLLLFLAAAGTAHAVVRYVNVNSTTPCAPYTDWSSAAVTIQDAVDASEDGDNILVTNGVYQTGGRLAADNATTNRVAVDKPVTVASVNGPQVTAIQGQKDAGGGTGLEAVRCVYLTNGAMLAGFTLTNGATGSSDAGGGLFCQSSSATASNCVLTGNMAYAGGGAAFGMLVRCTLAGNSASNGGGVYASELNDCAVTGNSATVYGGGSHSGTLINCIVSDNSAQYGGGGYASVLKNCVMTRNSADYSGGAQGSTLFNCTITGNTARRFYGGASSSTLNNCILYYNKATSDPNYYGGTLNYCCTTPLPASGSGNFTDAPQLASASHLSAGSPCLRKGSTNDAVGVDIDGESWASPPSIGCDEYWTGSVTGALNVAISSDVLEVVKGYPLNLQALIVGRTSGMQWNFGDGTFATNVPYASHALNESGYFTVTLTAYNESHPEGVSASMVVHVVEEVHYVAADSANPLWPYTMWTTAATNIQQAVDATVMPGALVLVSNGVYETGGKRMYGAPETNRVAVDKPITVASVNGPSVTTIRGQKAAEGGLGAGAVRCVYLTNGAILKGFTLTNGATTNVLGGNGGGVLCRPNATVSHCVITGNSAYDGGGADGGTLNSCILTDNTASRWGGGVNFATLNNCTVTRNSAPSGAGAQDATLNNCIVYYNTNTNSKNTYNSRLYNCCTIFTGSSYGTFSNCITSDPQLLADGIHISGTSPCRTNGCFSFTTGTDLDGQPWTNPPSIGCDQWHPAPVIIVQPKIRLASGLAGFIIEVLVEAQEPCSFWWSRDGEPIEDDAYYCSIHTRQLASTNVNIMHAGSYQVVVSNAFGMTTSQVAQVIMHCVDVSATSPTAPYSSWATAATNIQNAIDVALPSEIVLVTNGLYGTGGRAVTAGLTNRVVLDKAIKVLSVNGPLTTIIQGAWDPKSTNGGGAIRCAWLTDGAVLSGFTLRGGATRSTSYDSINSGGGGVWGKSRGTTVENCVIVSNSAGFYGGGSLSNTLNNCTLMWNSSFNSGGGMYASTLNHCVVMSNTAPYGGGIYGGVCSNCLVTGNWASRNNGAASQAALVNCTVVSNQSKLDCGGVGSCWCTNCIIYFNIASTSPNINYGLLYFSCTPATVNGTGNITNEPLFLDLASGNLRLQSNSPCINAGINASTPDTTDLDGNPRIVGGTVDMGAYECQSPALLNYYSWLSGYALPTDSSKYYVDSDLDSLNNWQEWKCQTDPTNRLSVLKIQPTVPTNTSVVVTWQSVAGVSYFVDRSTNLSGTPPFRPLATNLAGASGTTRFTDTNAPRSAPLFYRVGVGE